MKVRELIEILKKFDPDDYAFLTINGLSQYFWVDSVTESISGEPILESNNTPDYEDVYGFAVECFNENYKSLTPLKREILKEFIG